MVSVETWTYWTDRPIILWTPEWRLTDSITGMFYCKNFCRQYDVFLETCSLSNKTASQRIVQQRVYQTRVHDIDELRQRLITVWYGLEQRAVDDAIDQWQGRLLACVDAEGGHFEHNLGP